MNEPAITSLIPKTIPRVAAELAEEISKNTRYVEMVPRESKQDVRAHEEICVVRHWLGHSMAHAGIDYTNVAEPAYRYDTILLLPEDPKRSSKNLRRQFEEAMPGPIAVIITDSFRHHWRIVSFRVAIVIALPFAVIDRRGGKDCYGRTLESTEIAFADGIAAAAVVMREGVERSTVVIVCGIDWDDTDNKAVDVLRSRDKDLFR